MPTTMMPTTLMKEPNRSASLLEVLDRLMVKGVVADGQLVLAVADVDLICLQLKCLLAGVATLEQGTDEAPRRGGRDHSFEKGEEEEAECLPAPAAPWKSSAVPLKDFPRSFGEEPATGEAAPTVEQVVASGLDQTIQRINASPEKVEKGLAQLVLTVVELLRQLMERQAVRRMLQGSLTALQVEQVGKAFLRLQERMSDLKEFFELTDEDLNLDFGPLGKLI